MTTKKKTRGQLLAALRQAQDLFGKIGGAYSNDRQHDRAGVVLRLTEEGFNAAVEALSTDPPQRTSAPKAPMTPEALRAILEVAYSPKATCWGQATDEVMFMSRTARETLGRGLEEAVDFRSFATPSEWNTRGVESIVQFYTAMSPTQRREYLKVIKGMY